VREHRQRLRAQGMRPIQIWVLVLIVQEDGFAEHDSVTMCMSSSDPTGACLSHLGRTNARERPTHHQPPDG
jgi:hypothetical protein